MLKNRSNITLLVLALLYLFLVTTITNLNLINTFGYIIGSLTSPFVIIAFISRMTHWSGKQQAIRMTILAIVFQLLLLLPLESPKSLISLASFISLIGLVIAIVIELFQKRGKK